MHKRFLVFALTITLIAANGCYYYRVAVRGEPATDYQKKTMHSLFWGLVQEKPTFTDNCLGKGIHEVRVSTNAGYLLLSVATLGIWVPMDVEWKCTKETPPDTSAFR